MITLDEDRMTFRFPKVHPEAECSIELHRNLRIPDDDRSYPLPPGLGRFPLRHLDDFADRLSGKTLHRGGVVMPMHQAEAMWLNFDAGWSSEYPCAVQVAAGKVCAVSGGPWSADLNADPQNYLVIRDQPWLDGYCVGEGIIRQFVAMPLGEGYTAEEQLTGAAESPESTRPRHANTRTRGYPGSTTGQPTPSPGRRTPPPCGTRRRRPRHPRSTPGR